MQAIRIFFFCVFIGSGSFVFGQGGTGYSAYTHYGFLMAHHSAMHRLVKGHVTTFQFDLIRQSASSRPWERAYNDPEAGLSFYFSDLSNKEQLGYMLVASWYFDFRLFSLGSSDFSFRLSPGAAWLTERFDPKLNYKNNAIGSHLNAFVGLRFKGAIPLSEKVRIEPSLSLSHASNGAFKMPNLGINIPTIGVGLSWFPKGRITRKSYDHKPDSIGWHLTVLGGFGVTENDPPEGPVYGMGFASFLWHKNVSPKFRLGAGLDVFYSQANVPKIRLTESDFNNPVLNIQPGIKGSCEVVLGDLTIPLEAGGYLYTRMKSNGYFFQRMGLRYYTRNNFVFNLSLKTHFAKAEYIECGVGYSFR